MANFGLGIDVDGSHQHLLDDDNEKRSDAKAPGRICLVFRAPTFEISAKSPRLA